MHVQQDILYLDNYDIFEKKKKKKELQRSRRMRDEVLKNIKLAHRFFFQNILCAFLELNQYSDASTN